MSIIRDIVLNIITDKIIFPLLVIAFFIAGAFFICSKLNIQGISNILKPAMDFITNYFNIAINSLKSIF